MGYTTEFEGRVTVTPPLNPAEIAYLNAFADTRHIDGRDVYDVSDRGPRGNVPGPEVPGYYCQWVPTEDGTGIKWDGSEKFDYSVEWMQFLIDHFLRPGAHAQGRPGFEGFAFDHTVNGRIEAQGERVGDVWTLVANRNCVAEVRSIEVAQ